MAKILLVEDDQELRCMISTCLAYDHYVVESVVDGQEAIARLRAYSYDLILLDWGLPGLSGVEVCRRFRDVGGITPILMVTARREVLEKADGLDSGADDYLTKPFDMTELSARIRALLRRSQGRFKNYNLTFEDIILEPNNLRVTKNGADISLSVKEFALLELFMRHPGQIFPVDTIISRVWTHEESVSHESVRQHIMNLRRKIECDAERSIIQNVRGLGYRLETQSSQSPK